MAAIPSEDKRILDAEEITVALAGGAWTVDGPELVRSWSFKSYRAGFGFATQAAMLFERYNHHGLLSVDFGRVTIRLTSHDVGGPTERDLRMVRHLDKLV